MRGGVTSNRMALSLGRIKHHWKVFTLHSAVYHGFDMSLICISCVRMDKLSYDVVRRVCDLALGRRHLVLCSLRIPGKLGHFEI